MSEWIYPNTIRKLRASCSDFLNENISVGAIQTEIRSAENEIVAVNEQWVRQMLFDAENAIELLTFTVDDELLRSEVIPIVQNILNKIA
jgi:hypothetical protein